MLAVDILRNFITLGGQGRQITDNRINEIWDCTNIALSYAEVLL